MEIEVAPALTPFVLPEIPPSLSYPATLTLRRPESFTVSGGTRGGFSQNVLKYMPPGSFYTMVFDPEAVTLTIHRNVSI